MILLNEFLRKKQTKSFIKILTILLCIMFLLFKLDEAVKQYFDNYEYSIRAFLMSDNIPRDDILKKEKGIKEFKRALSFEKGLDNDVIYSPAFIVNGTAVEYAEERDPTRIEWNFLKYEDDILAFPASYCGNKLKENEAILFLSDKSYNQEYAKNYINKEITFKYQGQEVPLVINSIQEPPVYNHICISDSLYNELLQKEKKYMYDIKTVDYKTQEELIEKWNKTIKSDSCKIHHPVRYKDVKSSEKANFLSNIISLLNVTNFISKIIFLIVVIIVIKDLITEEEKDISLLKHIGYTKLQNFTNSLKNMLVLDLIILTISTVLSFLIILAFSIVTKLNFELFNFNFMLILATFIFIIELIYTIMYIKKY